MDVSKKSVHDFWNEASCGERLLLPEHTKEGFAQQSATRYQLEPETLSFAQFQRWRGKKVLEIGVGLGADHQSFAEHGAILSGVDLTERAIEHTRYRFRLLELQSDLQVADAEQLPFETDTFDLVYSWGVLHHSPDTARAIAEVFRILKPGGEAKIMIYHKWSFVGFMLWVRYALLRCNPLVMMQEIYARYLESPGTKAYSIGEAQALFSRFAAVKISTVLTHGDLLSSEAGQRHQGLFLTLARILWPRWLIRTCFPHLGLFMLITARKPATL